MNPVQLFKSLSDETRLRIVMLVVSEDELCVCELSTAIGDIQPKISRHLAQLRECGLLLDRRQGQWVFYRINPKLPEWASEILQSVISGSGPLIRKDIQRLGRMGDRPERQAQCC
jgi:ArsR family transcriptional regulator, arsenate/arsenite/antimonite-responsive transcriptional repressor